MTRIAKTDAQGFAVDITEVADPSKWPGFRDATGAGYLWQWNGTAWVDTAQAQNWRAQQKAGAIIAALENLANARGSTMIEWYARLHYATISRIAPASRTPTETAFINAVNAADAANP